MVLLHYLSVSVCNIVEYLKWTVLVKQQIKLTPTAIKKWLKWAQLETICPNGTMKQQRLVMTTVWSTILNKLFIDLFENHVCNLIMYCQYLVVKLFFHSRVNIRVYSCIYRWSSIREDKTPHMITPELATGIPLWVPRLQTEKLK
jgi:hypothetical protein